MLNPARLLLTVSLLGAPLWSPIAGAKEPSAMDVREFDRVFGHMKSDIDGQIKKGRVFPETIERTKKKVQTVIGYIERSGADPTPFQAKLDAYLASVETRTAGAARSNGEAKVKKNVPTIQPLLNIEPIPKAAPTWCAPIADQYGGAPIPTTAEIRMPATFDQVHMASVYDALKFSCSLADFGPTQAWTQAYRQRLSNLLGFTVAENEAFMKRAAGLFEKDRRPQPRADESKRCAALPGKTDGLVELRVQRDLERAIYNCGYARGTLHMQFNNGGGIPLWLVDLEAGPTTELGKLGLAVNLTLTNLVDPTFLMDPYSAPPKVKGQLLENYGLAHTIAFNADGVRAEVDALGLDGIAGFNVDVLTTGALHVLDGLQTFAMDASKQNPNLKAVFIQGPENGVAAYRATASNSTGAMDLLLAIEDRIGPDVGGINGCAQPLYAEFGDWLKAKVRDTKANQPKDIRFDDHRGAVLYHALLLCGSNDETAPVMAHLFEQTFWQTTGAQRGPVSAAYQGMLAAYSDARANPAPQAGGFSTTRGQPKTVVELLPLHANPVMPPRATRKLGPAIHGLEKSGLIASIRPADGGFSEVTFRTESVQRPIRDCQATNRIARIDEQGRLIPVYNCRTTGWQTVKVTNDPILMPAWLAQNHKPGQLLAYQASQPRAFDNTPSWGWPMAAYSNASGKTLVSMFGVPIP